MPRRRTPLPALSLAALAAVLGGCSTRTNVSATGNSPSLYTHVYVTAQAVWFNSSATAGPDDAGWVKFTPSAPVTVDLVADSGGNFASLATDLKLSPGSYAQLRLIPVDYSVTTLAASASALGARYNMEADCLDSTGVTHQLPLELLNPDKGLGIQASLSVPFGNVGAALGAVSSNTTAAGTTGTTLSATSGTTTSTTTTTAEFSLTFDGARDLTAFNFGGTSGVCGDATYAVLLSSHVNAYDLSRAGGIQGQLTLTNLSLPSTNGTGLEVSAQSLSADGSRHFVVARAPVASDGSFTLYPLAANSTSNASYDLVIHGPGIATIILKNILIPASGSNGASTTGTSTTGTTTNPDTSPITPSNLVSVGTLVPRAARASAYTANITTAAGAPLPAGAAVDFYQTLPSSGEVPYVIEVAPIDPFNQVLANSQSLSADTVDSGTYVSSGATITVVSTAPLEKAGTYQVAASAPLYVDGPLGNTVSAPTTAGVTTIVPVPGALALAAGSSAASLAASVHPASARKYDQGELMLSQNGQLIASAPLDAALTAGGGTVQLAAVPGGTPNSVYYVSVRAWNSSDPSGTLTRQWYSTPVDLRSAASANVQLTVD